MTSNPVALDILHFFPATLELATLATVIGVLVGVPAGVAAGALKGRWPDHLVRFLGLFGYSMPVFWLGLVGLWLFYAKLDWVAGPGRIDVGFEDLVEPRTGVLLVDAALARPMGRLQQRARPYRLARDAARLHLARLSSPA